METENKSMDTPQPQTANTTGMDAFGAPADSEGSNNNLSVEDAFFSKTESDEQSAPEQGQPAEQPVETTAAPVDARNDEKRYEYWQSQAAKKDNELRQFKGEVKQAIAQQRQKAPAQQAPVDEFPPPPPKPEKPRTFSREEAWSNPESESARYLDDIETYNDNINQYRDLRSQYDVAVIKEKMDMQEKRRQIAIQQQRQVAEVNTQKQGVYEHVQGHYGLTPQDAKEFVNSMSDPGSVSLDNLVDLYRMQKGQGQVNTQSQGPSDAFTQSRNAQQVPSPMGVMPAQSSQSQRSDADSIMDELINTHKSKNPWT